MIETSRYQQLAELDACKPLPQVARGYGINPSLPCRWKTELAENPEKAFRGNGNGYKDQALKRSLRLRKKRPDDAVNIPIAGERGRKIISRMVSGENI